VRSARLKPVTIPAHPFPSADSTPFSLGWGLFETVGTIHGVAVDASDVEALREGVFTLPAHRDVDEWLKELKRAAISQ
jgi:hypothetical protein